MAVDYGFNCPAGGQWYACAKGSRFVGCCASDPCQKGCAQGDVRPGGYDAAQHGNFSDASCGLESNFYSCASGGKTFWGCCKVNACQSNPPLTCGNGSLVPAFMERPEQIASYAPSEKSSSNGAIIGGAVGGGVVIALLIGVIIFLLCRKKRRQRRLSAEAGAGATASTPMMTEKHNHQQRISEQYGMQSPPPMYASPNPDYEGGFSSKNHFQQQPYQQYGYAADGPSELPAEMSSSSARQRYSELASETGMSRADATLSELPGASTQAASELESPHASPRPAQSEFTSDVAKNSRTIETGGTSTGKKT